MYIEKPDSADAIVLICIMIKIHLPKDRGMTERIRCGLWCMHGIGCRQR